MSIYIKKASLWGGLVGAMLLSSCQLYKNYERPNDIITDGIYGDMQTAGDNSLGDLGWRDLFTDPMLQTLIERGLKQNSNMKNADLRIKEADYALQCAKLAYVPTFYFNPSGTISKIWDPYDRATYSTNKTYSLPISLSWQIGSIGSLRNNKKKAEVTREQLRNAKQAIQAQLVASIASMYYNLSMLDEQLALTKQTEENWGKYLKMQKQLMEKWGNTLKLFQQVPEAIDLSDNITSRVLWSFLVDTTAAFASRIIIWGDTNTAKIEREAGRLPGVADAIRKINASGYLCIVVTNQPVIARGEVTVPELEEIHRKMETLLGLEGAYLDGLYYCPHHPHKGYAGEVPELKIECSCRKPKPGMLLKAAEDFNIDLGKSWMVGDGENDILAGRNAGCRTALICGTEETMAAAGVGAVSGAEAVAGAEKTGAEETGAENIPDFGQDMTVRSLSEFAERVLN